LTSPDSSGPTRTTAAVDNADGDFALVDEATMGGRTSGAREVTIRFDTRSVRHSGAILMCLVAALLLGLWLFSVTRHFLFLILLAWLFATALEPGIRALMTRGRSRGHASAIVGGGALVCALLLAVIFGRLFLAQIAALVRNAPVIGASMIRWVNHSFGSHWDASMIFSSLHLTPSTVGSWAGTISGGAVGLVGSVSAVLFDLVTVVVFGFYFAADGPNFFRTLAGGMPSRAQRVFLTVSEVTMAKTGGYVTSKVVLAALSTLFHGVFFVAIGVPYWLPFALFVGLTTQFVPLVGTYVGVALPVLATVSTSPWRAVAIVVFATVYQQVENYVFTPRVSKRTMDVNPAIALAAVFVGAAVWGPIGALIGIPLAAAGVAILDTYKHSYELVPEIARVGGDPKSGNAQ
jgi:predicted PurR-regulated permease PerM